MPTDDLTLPGSIPGLLRRGSPVMALPLADLGDGSVVDRDGWRGLILDKNDGYVLVALDASVATARRTATVEKREVALDLTDATGRFHARRWLGVTGHTDDRYRDADCVLLDLDDPRTLRLVCLHVVDGRPDRAAALLVPMGECCCPSSDPYECIRLRYGHLEYDPDEEGCTCACHDECERCGCRHGDGDDCGACPCHEWDDDGDVDP